jgi:RHS repeat-associated protein
LFVGIYETISGVRSLKYIVTPEGRAVKNGSVWDYEYNLKDHPIAIGIGNTRVVIRKGSSGLAEVIQERHYYPFGMEMSELSYGTGTNKYLYNSKEIQNDFDLYWYDYGARMYDPMLGRWHSVDNKAEKYVGTSPFAYALNNPILFIDPDGNDVVITNRKENGRNVVTFSVGIKIVNKSMASDKVVNAHVLGIKSQIEKSFSGFDRKTNTEYRSEVFFDNSGENNFTMTFVSDVNYKKNGINYINSSASGYTENGIDVKNNNMQVVLEPSGLNTEETNQTKSQTSRTGAHEYGHAVGLKHPIGDPTQQEGAVETIKSSPNNLMRQSEYSKGTEITNRQLEKARKIVEEQNQ